MLLNDAASDYQTMIDMQMPGSGVTTDYPPAMVDITGRVPTPSYTPINVSMGIPIATPPATGTTGDTGITSASLVDLAKAGLTAYGQIQLMNLQASLIKSGRPPLTAYQVAQMSPQLNFGLAPSTQNILTYALIGGAGLLLLTSLMKGRRA